LVAVKVKPLEAGTIAEEKLLEAPAFARQLFIIAPGHYHHGVTAP
jgi:hypothetical protein